MKGTLLLGLCLAQFHIRERETIEKGSGKENESNHALVFQSWKHVLLSVRKRKQSIILYFV